MIIAAGAAIALGASVFTTPTAQPEACTDRSELIAEPSPLDRPSVELAGSFTRCADARSGLITFHNRTPVAWTVTDAVSTTRQVQTRPSSAALALAWADRDRHGIVIAPGDTIRLPDWVAPYRWRPDPVATSLSLAVTAAIAAQTSAGARAGTEADPAFDAAAARCADAAVAAVPATDAVADLNRILDALVEAGNDQACTTAWASSVADAARSDTMLPSLRGAFNADTADAALRADADRASRWFEQAPLFVRGL
ncbi:hypothetical protein HQQ80_15035 [Microbacteriaceae bacterium VKM Ac-2855]|nr:hypothetical protein [Microbacteriaceae bacterium VKM Ac-2855]